MKLVGRGEEVLVRTGETTVEPLPVGFAEKVLLGKEYGVPELVATAETRLLKLELATDETVAVSVVMVSVSVTVIVYTECWLTVVPVGPTMVELGLWLIVMV